MSQPHSNLDAERACSSLFGPGAALPAPLTTLVGREREALALCELLRQPDVRLVNLIGPGGVGKTRLGAHVARQLSGGFRDGMIYVSLASVADAGLVTLAVVRALGLPQTSGRRAFERLKEHLLGRELLLFLDNFEHVVEAAPRIAEMLATCPSLKCLVTSRSPLHISGEYEYPVAPLTSPGPASLTDVTRLAKIESVDLFVQRVRAVRPDFRLSADNAPTVAEICNRLDGLPLAIELTAAMIKLLPLRAILSRLDRPTHLLVNGPRDAPSRQQTLRNNIAWSHNLLGDDDQRLFRRLSVFAGGCTPEAVAACCADGDVAPLVEVSLVQQVGRDDGEPRYAMLDTVREYGLDCLQAAGETQAARQLHASYYLALAEAGEAGLKTAEQEVWLRRLEAENANLREGLRWTLEAQEVEMALRLCGALGRFWLMRGQLSEGRRWTGEALAMADKGSPRREQEGTNQTELQGPRSTTSALAKALSTAGLLARFQGDYRQAAVLCGRGLRLCREMGDQPSVAVAIDTLASSARNGGRYPLARGMYREQLAIYRALGDAWGLGHTAQCLGALHWCEGNLLAARRWAQKALAILRSLNARWDVGYALIVLAGIARDCGEPASGHQLASEALRILRSMGDHRGAVIALGILGDVSAARCDDSAALPLYRETFPILVELGDRVSFLSRLLETARAMAGHQPEQAARLLAAHTTLLCTGGFSITDREHAGGQRCLARVRAQLGEAGFTKAWAAGRVLGWEGAVRCAMETLDGTPAAARRHPDESPRRPEPLLKQDHPDGLTSRELEVLRLVASGLTDAQVAGQLVISPRTVNTHLTSIYNKISVSSRAAATRYALQHELI